MKRTAKPLFGLLCPHWEGSTRIARALDGKAGVRVVGDAGSGASLLAASLFGSGVGKLLLVVPSARGLDRRVAELRYALDLFGFGGVAVSMLPEPARSPEEELPIHPRIALARAEATSRLHGKGEAIVVTPAAALRWGIASRERFAGLGIDLAPGTELDRDDLGERLTALGYARRQIVAEPGEYALRGYVVDVYSPDRGLPARAELVGDTVDSLRLFNPADQRSHAGVERYSAVPVRSVPLEAEEEAELRARLVARDDIEDTMREARHEMLHRGEEGPWLWREPVARAALQPVAAALGEGSAVVIAGGEEIEAALREQEALWPEPGKDPLAGLREKPHVEIVSLSMGDQAGEATALDVKSRPALTRDKNPYGQFLEEADHLGGEGEPQVALVAMESEAHARRLAARLLDREMRAMFVPDLLRVPGDVADALAETREAAIVITAGSLSDGLDLPGAGLRLYTHRDVYGQPAAAARRKTGVADSFKTPLEELKPGDYVVHIDHGIGIYDGLHTIRRGEEILDVVRLLYHGGDRLLLPVDKLTKLQKYSSVGSSADGEKYSGPRLDRLGGASWERVKSRVSRSIRRMAGELINLYATRSTIRGISHPPDDDAMAEFERSFPYSETPDQLRAMEEIKQDMESPLPMDRLLCGDVGFGKTELALRAAFKAASGGKQTAVLAPTTVLAQQHYETFRRRLDGGGFPFRVEMLSRFRSPAEQKRTIEGLKDGSIHIVVGTHRLLSKDIAFRDLGLLVVDEEQRFGVTHKEKLKRLRKKVDVLAMTATPIPRTLNMSMIGIRDISVIETPPRDRLSIQTEVLSFQPEMIRQAIETELARDGQVFYIHNRIERIAHVAAMLQRLVPDSRVAMAHAKMPPALLERTMAEFVAGNYDVLISTAIIENGLDIPLANTIIVDRADRFGLAQLYQLRGRVGRSERPAYAYLMVPPSSTLSADARRRLEAIREFSDLGSGFRVAAMDLEIRGAGNLLGGEQSGHIEAVGFELYNRLLEREVRRLRGLAGESDEEEFEATMNLKIDLHIPHEFVADAGGRMKIYRQVAGALDEQELDGVREQIRDLYGQPPQAVENLLRFARLKLRATALRLEKVEREGNRLAVKFTPGSTVNANMLAGLVADDPGARFTESGVLFKTIDGGSAGDVLEQVAKLLLSLGG